MGNTQKLLITKVLWTSAQQIHFEASQLLTWHCLVLILCLLYRCIIKYPMNKISINIIPCELLLKSHGKCFWFWFGFVGHLGSEQFLRFKWSLQLHFGLIIFWCHSTYRPLHAPAHPVIFIAATGSVWVFDCSKLGWIPWIFLYQGTDFKVPWDLITPSMGFDALDYTLIFIYAFLYIYRYGKYTH